MSQTMSDFFFCYIVAFATIFCYHLVANATFRNEETLEPEEYYVKFPSNIKESLVLVVDPMLATGGSVCHAVDVVKRTGSQEHETII